MNFIMGWAQIYVVMNNMVYKVGILGLKGHQKCSSKQHTKDG